jgi:hypothetical protein
MGWKWLIVEALGFKMLKVMKKTVGFLTLCQQSLALDGADSQILEGLNIVSEWFALMWNTKANKHGILDKDTLLKT